MYGLNILQCEYSAQLILHLGGSVHTEYVPARAFESALIHFSLFFCTLGSSATSANMSVLGNSCLYTQTL